MNKKFLCSVIVMIIVLSLIAIAVNIQGRYVLLEFQYDNGNISLLKKTLETGNIPNIEHEIEREYRIKLIGKDNVLYEFIFDPTKLYSDAPANEAIEGGLIELNQTIFYLGVPETAENEKIQLLKDNQVILEEEVYDVGAKVCRIE